MKMKILCEENERKKERRGRIRKARGRGGKVFVGGGGMDDKAILAVN